MHYQIQISSSAEKELEKLSSTIHARIIKKLLSLEENPRPKGVKKLSGREEYRLRVGNYRILYLIDDNNNIVVVDAVGHRREVYR